MTYTRKCKFCGRNFETTIPHKAFCNVLCKREFERKPHAEVKCARCGKLFVQRDSRSRYCSKACSARYSRKHEMAKLADELPVSSMLKLERILATPESDRWPLCQDLTPGERKYLKKVYSIQHGLFKFM